MSISPNSTICRLDGVPLSQHEIELGQLFAWLDDIRPIRVFVEIGSRHGGSFYTLSKQIDCPLCAISIDLPGGDGSAHTSDQTMTKVVDALQTDGFEVHQIIGNSHAPDTHKQLQHILTGRPIDFLFIDGDHSTLGVLQDIEDYTPLVRPGGIVALHDVGEPYGHDAIEDPHMGARALRILNDVNAAFTRLARGRRWAKIVHKWGIGVVWM